MSEVTQNLADGNRSETSRHRLRSFVICMIAVIAVLPLAVIFLVGGRSNSTASSPRAQCKNNLRQLALALGTYHDAYGTYPPAYVADHAGRPLYSWRVLILPYLDEKPLYEAFHLNEPWDSPHNLPYSKSVIEAFRCPGDNSDPMAATTNYVAVVGSNNLWEGANSVRRRDVKDGLDKTILLVEVAPATIGWAEPRDLSMNQFPLQINPPGETGISSRHHEYAQVLLCDGRVYALPNDLPASMLWQLLQRNDKLPTDENWPPRE